MVVRTQTGTFPCMDLGEGAPILFVHGAACDHRIWTPHVKHLAQQYRCIAPTLRWFGSTDWPASSAEFGETTHAEDLAAIIESLKCGPVFIIGWSYGANVALRLTVDRPDLVSRVVAYEPSATSLVSDSSSVEAHQTSMRETFLPVTTAASSGDGFGVLSAFIDAVGGPGTFRKLPPELRRICVENAHTLIPLLNSKHRFASVTVEDLANLSVPVHVAWGGRSGKVWTIPSESAARVTNISGHRIPDADHIWPASEPGEFLSWLKSLGELGKTAKQVRPATGFANAPTRNLRELTCIGEKQTQF